MEGTNNIADDGNYNIQVLEKAIEGVGTYDLLNLDKPGVRTSDIASDNQAFLCNSADHWFAIRKVHGIWFNLNSTNMEPGPQIVSDFYLEVFLEAVKGANYTIYTVRGDSLPQPKKEETVSSLRESQRYLGLDYLQEDYNQNKTRPLNTDGADQSEIDAAIKASLEDMHGGGFGPPPVVSQPSEDDDLMAAIALSLQQENAQPSEDN
uniref:ubiquitinyl hydrolase 1 n=1 Tax=Euplotes crassus TaxID=5936 RepID=A0A7S3KCE8_EUPCR|mmetsp:Transcript_20761/g.20507  ORF Transcript_20761/g.20507 Transcript_20761/m.20507 type:complete len:207 (+) Transcript_20761:203-823(+)